MISEPDCNINTLPGKNPELKLTSLKHAIENDQAVVRAEYDMKSIGGTLSLTYTINNKGAVKVTQKMMADKSKKDF